MPLTRKFAETVQARAARDPEFKAALFEEALQSLFDGDLEGAKELLRTCINATTGFQALSEQSGLPVKSIMRMVGPGGNPRLDNFIKLIRILQETTSTQATIHVLHRADETIS